MDIAARMDNEARRVGLKINMEVKKVMRIDAKNQELIMIAGQGRADVDEFTYLGATVYMRDVVKKTWKTDSQKQGVHSV